MDTGNWPEEPSDRDLSDCPSTVALPDGQALPISYSQQTAFSPDGRFVTEISCIWELSENNCAAEEIQVLNQESNAVEFRMVSNRDDLLGIPINALGILNLVFFGGSAFAALFVLRSMSLRSRLAFDMPVSDTASEGK